MVRSAVSKSHVLAPLFVRTGFVITVRTLWHLCLLECFLKHPPTTICQASWLELQVYKSAMLYVLFSLVLQLGFALALLDIIMGCILCFASGLRAMSALQVHYRFSMDATLFVGAGHNSNTMPIEIFCCSGVLLPTDAVSSCLNGMAWMADPLFILLVGVYCGSWCYLGCLLRLVSSCFTYGTLRGLLNYSGVAFLKSLEIRGTHSFDLGIWSVSTHICTLCDEFGMVFVNGIAVMQFLETLELYGNGLLVTFGNTPKESGLFYFVILVQLHYAKVSLYVKFFSEIITTSTPVPIVGCSYPYYYKVRNHLRGKYNHISLTFQWLIAWLVHDYPHFQCGELLILSIQFCLLVREFIWLIAWFHGDLVGDPIWT